MITNLTDIGAFFEAAQMPPPDRVSYMGDIVAVLWYVRDEGVLSTYLQWSDPVDGWVWFDEKMRFRPSGSDMVTTVFPISKGTQFLHGHTRVFS